MKQLLGLGSNPAVDAALVRALRPYLQGLPVHLAETAALVETRQRQLAASGAGLVLSNFQAYPLRKFSFKLSQSLLTSIRDLSQAVVARQRPREPIAAERKPQSKKASPGHQS